MKLISTRIEIRQHGKLVGVFPSTAAAARALGLKEQELADVLRGHQHSTGDGFTARYFSRKNYGEL